VTAIDSSAKHLERLSGRARDLGVDDRVTIIQADLDAAEWPDLGQTDLAWASASLHHLEDPDRALRRVRDALAPDGLLVVVELAGFPRFLPPDAPLERPGLEERIHSAADRLSSDRMPHRGANWEPMLSAAGFSVLAKQLIPVSMSASRAPAVYSYAVAALRRMRTAMEALLLPEDLAALDQLLDPDNPEFLVRRSDVTMRTERSMWAARPA
jgi:SAM-dependent methyltransferase